MKKKNWFFKLGLSAVFLTISFVAATASCSAKSSKRLKAKKVWGTERSVYESVG